jgi:hypothetical protein
MGKYVNIYGMEERWGQDETKDSRGGHLGNPVAGEQVIEIPVNLKDLENGVSQVFPGVMLPKNAMITKTETYVTEAGVGAASVDFGVVAVDRKSTFKDEDGLIGGCPVTDEGELHKHEDQDATFIGIVTPEATWVTCKAGGDFTDGGVVFRIFYRAAAQKRPGRKLVEPYAGWDNNVE